MVLGLERDQQDAEARNITNVRVLKNRFSGDTGLAATLRYSHITGRLSEEEIADDPIENEQTPFS